MGPAFTKNYRSNTGDGNQMACASHMHNLKLHVRHMHKEGRHMAVCGKSSGGEIFFGNISSVF